MRKQVTTLIFSSKFERLQILPISSFLVCCFHHQLKNHPTRLELHAIHPPLSADLPKAPLSTDDVSVEAAH